MAIFNSYVSLPEGMSIWYSKPANGAVGLFPQFSTSSLLMVWSGLVPSLYVIDIAYDVISL